MSSQSDLVESWRSARRGRISNNQAHLNANDPVLDWRQQLDRTQLQPLLQLYSEANQRLLTQISPSQQPSMLATGSHHAKGVDTSCRPETQHVDRNISTECHAPQQDLTTSSPKQPSTYADVSTNSDVKILSSVAEVLTASHSYNCYKDRLKTLEKTMKLLTAELKSQPKHPHIVFSTHLQDKISKTQTEINTTTNDLNKARYQRNDLIQKASDLMLSHRLQDEEAKANVDARLIDLECLLQQEREKRADERDEFKKQIQSLEKALADLTEKVTRDQALRTMIHERQSTTEALENMEKLERKMAALEGSTRHETSQKDQLKSQIIKAEKSIDQLNERLRIQEESCGEALTDQLQQLQAAVHNVEQRHTNLDQEQTTSFVDVRDEMRRQHQVMESLSSSLKTLGARQMRLSDPDRQTINSIQALAVDFNSRFAQISRFAEGLKRNDHAIVALNSRLSDLTTECLHAEMAKIAVHHSGNLRETVTRAQRELQAMQAELRRIRESGVQYEKQSESMRLQMGYTIGRIGNVEATLVTTQESFTDIRLQLNSSPSIADVQQISDKLNEFCQSVSKSRTILEDLQQRLLDMDSMVQDNFRTCLTNNSKITSDLREMTQLADHQLKLFHGQTNKENDISQENPYKTRPPSSTSNSVRRDSSVISGILKPITNELLSRVKSSSRTNSPRQRSTSRQRDLSTENGSIPESSSKAANIISSNDADTTDTDEHTSMSRKDSGAYEGEGGARQQSSISQGHRLSTTSKRKHGDQDNISSSEESRRRQIRRGKKAKKKHRRRTNPEIIVVDD